MGLDPTKMFEVTAYGQNDMSNYVKGILYSDNMFIDEDGVPTIDLSSIDIDYSAGGSRLFTLKFLFKNENFTYGDYYDTDHNLRIEDMIIQNDSDEMANNRQVLLAIKDDNFTYYPLKVPYDPSKGLSKTENVLLSDKSAEDKEYDYVILHRNPVLEDPSISSSEEISFVIDVGFYNTVVKEDETTLIFKVRFIENVK